MFQVIRIIVATVLLISCRERPANMKEYSNECVSIMLSRDWVVDSPKVSDDVVFQGQNSNKYIILSSYSPNMNEFSNMKEAISYLNTVCKEAAQNNAEWKADIKDFGYLEQRGYLHSGHVGLIPGRGLVFFRLLIASNQHIANFYMEFTGFSKMPDLQQLNNEFVELSHQISVK